MRLVSQDSACCANLYRAAEGECLPSRRFGTSEVCHKLTRCDRRRYAAAGRSSERIAQVLRDVSNTEVEVRKRALALRPSSKQGPAQAQVALNVIQYWNCTQTIIADTEDNDTLLHMAQSTRCSAYVPPSAPVICL